MSEFRELIKDIAGDCEIILAHAEDGALHIVHAAPGAIEKFFEATIDYFGFKNEPEAEPFSPPVFEEVKENVAENKTENPLAESESGSAGVQSDVVAASGGVQENGVADSGGVSGT